MAARKLFGYQLRAPRRLVLQVVNELRPSTARAALSHRGGVTKPLFIYIPVARVRLVASTRDRSQRDSTLSARDRALLSRFNSLRTSYRLIQLSKLTVIKAPQSMSSELISFISKCSCNSPRLKTAEGLDYFGRSRQEDIVATRHVCRFNQLCTGAAEFARRISAPPSSTLRSFNHSLSRYFRPYVVDKRTSLRGSSSRHTFPVEPSERVSARLEIEGKKWRNFDETSRRIAFDSRDRIERSRSLIANWEELSAALSRDSRVKASRDRAVGRTGRKLAKVHRGSRGRK